ncbi:MAG: hypothetical protein GX937_07955 [Lentisphaerae bacterium]|jgi:hypothetical protein|nr:hypothetical protein [Lentisphaerota bacterium]
MYSKTAGDKTADGKKNLFPMLSYQTAELSYSSAGDACSKINRSVVALLAIHNLKKSTLYLL